MNKYYILIFCLFSCTMMHASSSLNDKLTRPRSVSQESVETVISSRSSSPSTIIEIPATIVATIAPTQTQTMHRHNPVYDELSTCQLLQKTAESYKDEIKDCYENGIYKCCNAPMDRPDLNFHPQVQDCRCKCCFGCFACLTAGACFGTFGYFMVYKSIILHS